MVQYFKQTKSLAFSLLAISPLIAFYEVFIFRYNIDPDVQYRNAAEVFIKDGLRFVGIDLPWQQALCYVALFLAALSYSRHKRETFPKMSLWGYVILESLVYASIFGLVTSYITDFFLRLQSNTGGVVSGFFPEVLLAIAAGIYEELLFRLIIVGFFLILFKHLLPLKLWMQALLASALSAIVFSIFHYPSWQLVIWHSFVFRFVAGCILGLLFVYRGFAIAVYTHAFYDIFFLTRKLF